VLRCCGLMVLAMLADALAVTVGAQSAAPSTDPDPLANYYRNTLIWQNQTTHAIGRLWLNPDGRYFAFFNMGPQAKMPDTHGPFQVQGREGSYTLRAAGAQYRLCLWPQAPRITLGAQVQGELYAGADCYPLAPHPVGDLWSESTDPAGPVYKFWFVRGR